MSAREAVLQGQNNNATRRRNYFRQQYIKSTLKACGMRLIHYTLLTIATRQDTWDQLSVYMDEMLHSIFFLGYIHKESLTPEEFMNPNFRFILSTTFPEPFKKYRSHLPTRTPFSILLSMMETLYVTEEKIKEKLLDLLKQLEFPNPLHKAGNKNEQYYTLESTVICVCYSESDQKRNYGASLSCRRNEAKRIFIDLSCLQTWHEYVSHAVMSYYPVPSGDGISFPASVRCQAYVRDWNENVYKERRPCLNCKDLFNLQDADPNRVEYPYGNCAETECLSKLLFSNNFILETTQISSHTEEKLENLRASTRSRLKETLAKVNVQVEEEEIAFYIPSRMHQIPDFKHCPSQKHG